jgi:hypothetical protein
MQTPNNGDTDTPHDSNMHQIRNKKDIITSATKRLPETNLESDILDSYHDADDEDGFGANQQCESDAESSALEDELMDEDNLDSMLEDVTCDSEDDLNFPDTGTGTPAPHNLDPDDDDNYHVLEALELFGYGVLSCLTHIEAVSLALYIIKLQSNAPCRGYQEYQELLQCLLSERPFDIRTVHTLLERKTGIKYIQYQVCENNCHCFAEKPNADACPECGTPRPKKFNKFFECLDMIHLYRLWYSHSATAIQFQVYKASLRTSNEHQELRDFWDGKLVQKLQAEGFFADDRDLAFLFSTDGVNLFRKGMYKFLQESSVTDLA